MSFIALFNKTPEEVKIYEAAKAARSLEPIEEAPLFAGLFGLALEGALALISDTNTSTPLK